jgi:maleylacetate reductase
MTTPIFSQVPRDRVYPDSNVLWAIEAELDRRKVRRALILSSASLAGPGGPVRAIAEAIGPRCVGVGTMLREHTPLHGVIEAADVARAQGADALVAIGGGSVIDGTKVVKAALAANLTALEDFTQYSAVNVRALPAPEGGPPIIAVPTTLSAAEFTATGGYTNPLSGLKEGLRAPHLTPATVILDPDLACHTPLRLWNSSGLRSIDHAVETVFATGAWPALIAQAATGLTMLARALRDRSRHPDDRNFVRMAQQAVWLISDGPGQVPMGASHGLGYLLGSLGNVPHGMTSCVLLPAVIAWNTENFPIAGALVANALGADDAADGARALIVDLGLPTQIRDLGVAKGLLDDIASIALMHPVVRTNPRPFADGQAVRALLETAW